VAAAARQGGAGTEPGAIAGPLLAWFEAHGRHDLPWQRDPSPYRVWVSEIMLQQTQVQTVIPYYERFMARFPDVDSLAEAPPDELLHLWSGLGYYARARNLHQAARIVRDAYGGELPRDMRALLALPGIGRSTAGAILALARRERQPILDGNAKRVLARYHAVAGWPGESPVERRLWEHAETETPHQRVAEYTQAIMDLGATVCTRTRPACERCPLAGGCRGRASGKQTSFPGRRPRASRPVRETVFVIARDRSGRVLLEQRPPTGIWGGLWGFPECGAQTDLERWCRERLDLVARERRALAVRRHGFTHFELTIHPVVVEVETRGARTMEGNRRLWYKAGDSRRLGLAAPVAALLEELETGRSGATRG
jgi:A/G-specific adenine glycosylase